MAGAFPPGSLVDPMSHDDDYGGATVATITFDDHGAFGVELKASQGRAGWKTSGLDTLLAPSAIPAHGAPFDATAPAVPLADAHDIVPERYRIRDVTHHALDDLELFHRAVDGDDDTWDVLLGAFEEHCLERGHRANANADLLDARRDDAAADDHHPDPADPTPPRRPRASTSKSTSGDERVRRPEEAEGTTGQMLSVDRRCSDDDGSNGSTNRTTVRQSPSHADLDEAVRRWSVGEGDGDGGPRGSRHGGGWYESLHIQSPADHQTYRNTFTCAFDDDAYPFACATDPSTHQATRRIAHAPLEHDDDDDDASPPRLIATAGTSAAGHASHVLRSLIFGKGELRRGKTKTADRSKKVRRKPAGCGRAKRTRSGFSAKDAANDDVNGVGVGVARGRLADGDDDDDAHEEEEDAAGTFAARNPTRWVASESAAATSDAVDADMSAAIHAATQSGAKSGTIAAMTRALSSLRNGIADELVTLSQTEARTVSAAMAADARAGRVNHRGLLFDDADTAHSAGLSEPRSIELFVGNSSSAVALRFRECRFRILRQFNRDAMRCLVAHCGVDAAREWDTGDVVDPRVFDDSEGSVLERPPRAPLRLDQNFLPQIDHQGAGEETTADRLCRTHSQTLTQLARDAPASLKASSGLLARKQLLLGGSDLGRELRAESSSPRRTKKKVAGSNPTQRSRANLTARKQHSGEATEVLERWFWDNFYPTEQRPKPVPTREEKRALATATGLSERQVADWFVNARARKWKPRMEQIMKEVCGEVGEEGGEGGA